MPTITYPSTVTSCDPPLLAAKNVTLVQYANLSVSGGPTVVSLPQDASRGSGTLSAWYGATIVTDDLDVYKLTLLEGAEVRIQGSNAVVAEALKMNSLAKLTTLRTAVTVTGTLELEPQHRLECPATYGTVITAGSGNCTETVNTYRGVWEELGDVMKYGGDENTALEYMISYGECVVLSVRTAEPSLASCPRYTRYIRYTRLASGAYPREHSLDKLGIRHRRRRALSCWGERRQPLDTRLTCALSRILPQLADLRGGTRGPAQL